MHYCFPGISTRRTCITVKTTIGRLADKGFAGRLLIQDKIKEELAAAETAIGDALTIFNVEIASARKADQEELIARLDSLVYNDRKILSALQDDARRQRRLGELIVAFTKCLSRRTASGIPHWVVTSLEVGFDPDDQESCIGKGAFCNIYKGECKGQVVAVEEMHGDDAQMLTAVSLKNLDGLTLIAPFLFVPIAPLWLSLLLRRAFQLHEISLGMTYLHNQGVIHADLKAANVLVGDDQKAVITDFGLNCVSDGDEDRGDAPLDGLVPFGHLRCASLFRRVVNERERPYRPGNVGHTKQVRGPVFATIQIQLRSVLLKGRTTTGPIDTSPVSIPYCRSPASFKGPEDPPSAPPEYLSTTTSTEHLLRVETAYSKVPAEHQILSEESHKELQNGTLGEVNHRVSRPTKPKDPAKSTREPRRFPPANSCVPPLALSGVPSTFIKSAKTFDKTRMRPWGTTSLKALITLVYGAKSLINGSYSLEHGSAGATSSALGITLSGTVL
ncbi:hypothetical protein BDN71DRAFT_1425963 [Pleurotus eryngii]|uniref:Protein kinase domain-containing protein n=1 Tax=Pleurotus eryngii TaxID=5323 RepID=A0A9P6ACL1_PLEER|nr:hypothetical protein BDN71DRAFT_1425963 [Pleurotus eryngii]